MLNFHSKWSDAILKLHEQVNPYVVSFEELTFLDWTRCNGFEIGPHGHPLEKAHTAAANYINMVTTEGKINGH